MRNEMNMWYDAEHRMRRDELLASAGQARLARLAVRGRSRSLRGRIANGAQILSDLFAGVAHQMRDNDGEGTSEAPASEASL
jgi:hypothetical protein